MRKLQSQIAKRDVDIIGVYFSKQELRNLLGSKNYQKYIEEITKCGILTLLDKMNSYGNPLYYFAPRELTFARFDYVPRNKKRIYKSLQLYKNHKIGRLSQEEELVLSNLSVISTSISDTDFHNYYTAHYPIYVEECHQSSKKPIDFGDYSKQYEYYWSDFKAFLDADPTVIFEYLFIDKFGKRTHTPITRSPKFIRLNIQLENSSTISLDLKQSQPTILAKTLEDIDPKNDYTNFFKSVEDIYHCIAEQLDLPSRKAAKEAFFLMIFGKPFGKHHDTFAKLFPLAGELIKNIKTVRLPENPSSKIHSNLALIMQRTETSIFHKVWGVLGRYDIVFTPCHDEIIVPLKHLDLALTVMNDIISAELPGYKITISISRPD